jgi:hypothetical protein
MTEEDGPIVFGASSSRRLAWRSALPDGSLVQRTPRLTETVIQDHGHRVEPAWLWKWPAITEVA